MDLAVTVEASRAIEPTLYGMVGEWSALARLSEIEA